MQLQPFRVLVDALAVPVYATLHYLGRGACKDYVRLVEPFGNDAAPTYNAVVGDSHILAYLDILAHPYVTAYLNAFGIIDRVSFEVGNRVGICAPHIHAPAQLAVIADADTRMVFLQIEGDSVDARPVAYGDASSVCSPGYACTQSGQLPDDEFQPGHAQYGGTTYNDRSHVHFVSIPFDDKQESGSR